MMMTFALKSLLATEQTSPWVIAAVDEVRTSYPTRRGGWIKKR